MELDRIPAQLGDIIEPNEFYICCIKPKNSARVKLNRFSDIVAKDHKALEFDDPEEDINVGQLVYVKRDDDTWTRARVVEVYNSKNRKIWIKVLLIDHGQLLNVFDVYTQVVDIPEKSCSKVPAQSKKFRLEDLQPLESCINYVTNEKSYRASKKWSHESAKLVKTLLSIAYNIQVELNNYDEVDDVYTGQLYFCVHHDELKKRGMQAKNQPLSLSRILVKHNHAVELEKEDNGIAVTSEKELFKGDSDSIEELISQMPEPLFSSTHNDEIQLVNPTKKKKTTKSNVEEVEVSPDFVKFLQHRKESKNSASSKIKESRLDRLQTTSDLAAIKVTTKPEEVEDVAKFKYKPSLARFLEKKKQLDCPPPSSSSLSPTTVPKPAAVQAKYLVNVNDKEEVFVHKDPAARTCKPIGRLDDLLDLRLEYFHHLVETLNISSPRHVIQKSMWPIVHNLYSMVAIGSRNKSNPLHGRIGGYLVPLVNQVLTCQDYAPTSNPPLAIILVPDWQSAQDVSEIATELGSHIVLANDGKTFRVGCVFANEMKHAAELYNGCHVLVTTPTSLKRMLDPSINITSLERCSHLIIEFADTCIIKFHQEIDDISKTFLKLRRRFPNQPNQMIVSSDEWSEPIRQYVQCFLMRPDCIGPYFVLGNPLEALVYSKLKFKAHVVETCKQDQLVQLLLNEKKSLSVVFCKDSLSVAKVQRMLQMQHVLQLETISITEEMSKFDKEETCSYLAEKQKNTKAENLVLVMSDQCTLDFPLSLTHLTTIVHYDYSDSKMQFADRFLHMKKCVTSIYSGDKDEEENYCHLLVDPQDDEKQFKTLRLLLERCQCSVPPLLMMSLMSNVETESTTTSLSKSAPPPPLCIHIKLFGHCDNLSKCRERHFLTHQIDDQGPAAAAGLIEFSIAMTKSANHFLVLLKKIFNPETGKIFDFLSVDMKLLRLNSRLEFESLESDAELQIGEIYVVKDVDSCSKRVEYVKKSKEQQKITVLFIDEGRYEKWDIDCLYQLPPEFKEELIPRKTSEVILMNVRPKDQQPQWPHEANELVRLALNSRKEEEKQSDQICRSKVVLGLNHTFWVRNVQVLQKVHNQWSAQVELKDQLKSFAQDHFQQMASLLLSLCLNSKIDPDRYQYLRKIVHAWNGSSTLSEEADDDDHHQNTSVVSSNQSFRIDEEKSIFTSYRTAFFDPDDQVNNEIKVMEIFSPAYFNVQLTKFQPQLKALEAKLKTEFEMFNNDNFVPIHQQICISKCDEIYCRVQYLLDDNDNDQANEELYLVDFGWYSPIQSKLVPISKQSLEVLPFQAIRCSLAHVKPNDDDNEKWTEEAFEDFSQHLDCVFWVNQHTKIENGHYEVDLVDPETLTQVASKLALNGHCQLVGQLFDVSKFESSQSQVKSAPIGSQQQQQQKVVVVGEDGNNEKMDSQSEKVSIDKKIITTTTERESKTQKLGLKLKEIREQFNEIKSHIALLSDLDLNDNGHCDDDEDLSIPSLVVSQDLIAAEKFPDKVTWSQSLQGLTFKLQFHGFEVNQSQVYIRVEPKILQFHYLDIDEKNRCCQLFRIPNLALFTQVKPQDTRIVVKPTLIKIYLQKAQSLYWPKPCFDQVTKKGVTHPWLRQEVVEISDSEDNDEDVEGLNVTPMSILGVPNEIDYFSDNEDVVKEADYGDSEDSSEDTNQVPDD